MFKMMGKFCVIFVLAVFLISACGTSPINISYDLSPAELIQRAQEASDRNRYNVALQYYQALYDRNRGNIDLVITAEYEIAFIHYKKKNYQQSREELTALLKYYDSPDAELLPQQFRVLANIVLKRIEEKENQKTFFSRFSSKK
jgi:outer membrane protein assembly factor BamD (BamD/ComL family)